MMINSPASFDKRVQKSSVNHDQILSRIASELASARPLKGSSMMPRSRPKPVMPPPTVTLRNEPSWPANSSKSVLAAQPFVPM
jgi:hypothetical protein